MVPASSGVDGPEFARSDLKAFLARNADAGAADSFPQVEVGPDLNLLLEAVRARADEMAHRALDVFCKSTPETALWSAAEQERFVAQSRRRFETILDVTGAGDGVDDDLVSDLEAVGAGAATADGPLPQLLGVLRISRDLVVQTAVEVAEAWGRRWGLALSLLLNRVLPALDRLTDALAQGYWAAVVGREETLRARCEHLMEHSDDGARAAERAKHEFLDLITHDLRAPITTILGLAVTLEAYGGELPPERSRRTGASIRRQAERISRLADDLYVVSCLENGSLDLSLRAVSVLDAIDAALASLRHPEAVDVAVDSDLVALADARRLEQVVANLVENAVAHGAPPVRVGATPVGDGLEMSVTDAGPGVAASVVPNLFSRLEIGSESGEHLGSGVGLFLVRGLVEAMGGRVDYEPVPDGGACFRVRLLPPGR